MSRRTLALVVLNTLQVLLALAWFGVHTEAAQAAAHPAWGWPLAGETSVERPFAPPSTPWGAGHRGVDLLAQEGETVLAAGDGVVSYAGLLAGKGVVAVQHAGGLRTTYEPVTATVRVGEHVSQGDPLGVLARGHASCRPGTTCLHWGLLRGQTYLDPLSVVTQGRLRLLPVGGGPGAGPSSVVAAVGPAAEPAIGPSSSALAEPRRRAGRVLVDMAANVAGAAVLGYGLLVLARRFVRLARRRRR